MSLRLVSWNVQQRDDCWLHLVSDPTVDVALLQEARPPPTDVASEVHPSRDTLQTTAGYTRVHFRTAIARCSERVVLRPRETAAIGTISPGALPVSREGTLTVADLVVDGEVLTVVSAYACWESPVGDTTNAWIYADASAHRLVSDLTALLDAQRSPKVLLAGDFNLLHKYGEHGDRRMKARYATFFDRLAALGLTFVGPQAPHGRQAEPWPDELPRESLNVPSYHTTRQSPETATRQLDFVFATEALRSRVQVLALNRPDEWGPGDHCRVVIDVDLAR